MNIVAIDIGGTSIKGGLYEVIQHQLTLKKQHKVESSLHETSTALSFDVQLHGLIKTLLNNNTAAAIGISTAGFVDYSGKRVFSGNDYLSPLKTPHFAQQLAYQYGCPVSLINDCDAAQLAIAKKGCFEGYQNYGIMVIGTGLGFSLSKNGQRWKPDRKHPALGAIDTPMGNFDKIVSASQLAKYSSKQDLTEIFVNKEHEDLREEYLKNLVKVIKSASLIYQLPIIYLGGGLVNATESVNYPLEDELNQRILGWEDFIVESKVICMQAGNQMQLEGAAHLAYAESFASTAKFEEDFSKLPTEASSAQMLHLEELSSQELVSLSLKYEDEAAQALQSQEAAIAEVAQAVYHAIAQGGRLIYVGCGTSGRVAAMDAVELNCTYGLDKDKSLALISGGSAEAAVSIEEEFEEDASAIPDLLNLNLNQNDIVIGISASSTAYYVRSALGYAQGLGIPNCLISVQKPTDKVFYQHHIALGSGSEMVIGSTRMKAGTATKKVLNAISTTAMVLDGRVAGQYMVGVACFNDKLVTRAQTILHELFGIDAQVALSLLKNNDMNLANVVKTLRENA